MKQSGRGEIWMATLDPTKGREQAGIRPVLIVSSDYFNQGPAELVFAIPITSQARGIRSHIPIMPPEGGLTLPSFVMCEAMRSISKQRLTKKMGSVLNQTMSEIEDVLKILLEL